MSLLQVVQGVFRLADHNRIFTLPELTIERGQCWAFVGANGSGKSALGCALEGSLLQLSGLRDNHYQTISRLSFEQLQALMEEEWRRNNSDLFTEEDAENGRTSADIIQAEVRDPQRCRALAQQFAIETLLTRPFKYLSSGETRKVLLCQALMQQPDLLILDEPFDSLDSESRAQLTEMLRHLVQQKVTLVLIVNRLIQIPDFVTHIGIVADCSVVRSGLREQMLSYPMIHQFTYSAALDTITLPEVAIASEQVHLPPGEPLITLHNGCVTYHERPILQHLEWQVLPGQHWHIVGPNGAGKSTLLSLVTGDHPQGYSNDLTLFGHRRGSGETIWQIKRYIGYVSNSLHLDYRVATSVLNVILSGFFDSIGLYQAAADRHRLLAEQWLQLLGFSQQQALAPFHSLSWGQQRLLLIARAMVKRPPLLILDEPLQGLDPLNRQWVRHWIDLLIRQGGTQLLFVSHHLEDTPDCITHRLQFIPDDVPCGYRTETTEV
ncbi:MAG: molybdate ABC transporter ATP-binding protein ModF [Enterobacteriaceae bacterium]